MRFTIVPDSSKIWCFSDSTSFSWTSRASVSVTGPRVKLSPGRISCSLVIFTPLKVVPYVLPASRRKARPPSTRTRACCRDMSAAVITRSHVGARPMTVSPSRSKCTRGIEPSMNVSLNTPGSVLGLGEALDGQPGVVVQAREHRRDRRIVDTDDEKRILGSQPEPVARAPLEKAERAAFDAHRVSRSIWRAPQRLFGVGVCQTNDCVERDDIDRLFAAILFLDRDGAIGEHHDGVALAPLVAVGDHGFCLELKPWEDGP